jgi:hypothetical protein
VSCRIVPWRVGLHRVVSVRAIWVRLVLIHFTAGILPPSSTEAGHRPSGDRGATCKCRSPSGGGGRDRGSLGDRGGQHGADGCGYGVGFCTGFGARRARRVMRNA